MTKKAHLLLIMLPAIGGVVMVVAWDTTSLALPHPPFQQEPPPPGGGGGGICPYCTQAYCGCPLPPPGVNLIAGCTCLTGVCSRECIWD